MFSAIKPYLSLCRVSNLPTVATNALAAVVLTGAGFGWSAFLLLLVSVSAFYGAGMCLNDRMDVAADRIAKPFRPLPSGRVSLRGATVLTGALFAAGLLPLFLVPFPRTAGFGLLLGLFIVAYDLFHRAHPSTVLLMGACRAMVFVVCAVAVTGGVPGPVALVGSLQFLYVLAISLVARFENGRKRPFAFPVIPVMIAGISLIDGAAMAFFASPLWIAAGIGGALLTLFGQRYVRGD
jgi:4-hydroxybenzoate polyprenyltransferase